MSTGQATPDTSSAVHLHITSHQHITSQHIRTAYHSTAQQSTVQHSTSQHSRKRNIKFRKGLVGGLIMGKYSGREGVVEG
jgi:hypothetical protein